MGRGAGQGGQGVGKCGVWRVARCCYAQTAAPPVPPLALPCLGAAGGRVSSPQRAPPAQPGCCRSLLLLRCHQTPSPARFPHPCPPGAGQQGSCQGAGGSVRQPRRVVRRWLLPLHRPPAQPVHGAGAHAAARGWRRPRLPAGAQAVEPPRRLQLTCGGAGRPCTGRLFTPLGDMLTGVNKHRCAPPGCSARLQPPPLRKSAA